MSMSRGTPFDSEDALVNDINMTPLIDVMLVLLIIFIITLPVINQAVKIELPKGEAQASVAQDETVDVSITADGAVLWNKEPLNEQQLAQRVAVTAVHQPLPILRVYADKSVRYEQVLHVMATAQKGGLTRIDLVTDATPSP